METELFKFDQVDEGFCRIYYKQQKSLFCFQENFPNDFTFYNCSKEGEPEYPLKWLPKYRLDTVPVSETSTMCKRFWYWVQKNNLLLENGEKA